MIAVASSLIFSGCKSTNQSAYEMQSQLWDEEEDTLATKIYITGTKPIDSVDINKLIFDIFRIEIDYYPDSLSVFARVYDSTGNFVTNMADPYKEDDDITYFTAVNEWLGKVYNKREAPIEHFKVREFGKGDSIPYNIVLSVDYSGSMDPVMSAIFEGTEIFVQLKHEYDKIAITSFNHQLDVKVPLIQDSTTILTLYRNKREQGFGLFSGVYQAIWKCMQLFDGTSKEVPRVLVVFSDGDDNYSRKEIGELIERAKEEKIHIFTVAFGYSKDDNLKFLAEYTGGKFYKARSKEELIAIFRDIYMSLRYYYHISYEPPKYWGYHKVYADLVVPGRQDTLIAEGEYDVSDLWRSEGDEFTRPILFDFDKSTIKPESKPIIDEIVDAMMSRPKLMLEIQGHTDNKGSIGYNQKLSEARAKAVYDAIINAGIEARRLRYRGFGESRPIATNETEEGQAKNRRTQFLILAK